MKSFFIAFCAIVISLSLLIPAHAENASSNLSSVSVKIGTKSYSGNEARKLLFSRVQAQESMRKTDSEKTKFLASFDAKLKKLITNYEKKGWKSAEVAKVLLAVSEDIRGEMKKLAQTLLKTATEKPAIQSEIKYYSGYAYVPTGSIITKWSLTSGEQASVQDIREHIKDIFKSGKMAFDEDYGISRFSKVTEGADRENLAYHRYYASENGKSPLKGVSVTLPWNATVILVTEIYENWSKLYISTRSLENDWKVVVRGGYIREADGTSQKFGSEFMLDGILMAGKTPTEREKTFMWMYVQ